MTFGSIHSIRAYHFYCGPDIKVRGPGETLGFSRDKVGPLLVWYQNQAEHASEGRRIWRMITLLGSTVAVSLQHLALVPTLVSLSPSCGALLQNIHATLWERRKCGNPILYMYNVYLLPHNLLWIRFCFYKTRVWTKKNHFWLLGKWSGLQFPRILPLSWDVILIIAASMESDAISGNFASETTISHLRSLLDFTGVLY